MVPAKAPPPMPDDMEEEDHPQGVLKLEDMTALELLIHIQEVFEQNLEKDEPWIEVYYKDRFEQVQYMRLWMRPAGHHVSRSKH